MPKRRMISEAILVDREVNELSIEAQNIFFRLLTVADDCGVVPGEIYALGRMINCPKPLEDKLHLLVKEIEKSRLVCLFQYNNRPYLCFNPETYYEYNKILLAKRTKSEYLKIHKDEFLSEKFMIVTGIAEWFGLELKEDEGYDVQEVADVKGDKLEYAKGVFLTEEEHSRLADEFTLERTDEAVQYLSDYKYDKAYKFRDANRTLRRWVFDALNERDAKRRRLGQELSKGEPDVVEIDTVGELNEFTQYLKKQGITYTNTKKDFDLEGIGGTRRKIKMVGIRRHWNDFLRQRNNRR